ncbi:MAG TPA: hypothetical protein DIW49_02910 [Clostridiales bacterium]|nr:hypothetical protein [Clostridiales bacterium]
MICPPVRPPRPKAGSQRQNLCCFDPIIPYRKYLRNPQKNSSLQRSSRPAQIAGTLPSRFRFLLHPAGFCCMIEKSGKFRDFWCMIRTFSGMIRTSVPEGCPMMRLTPLSLAANTIFYLILAVMYCRVLTRRFSWPFTLLGLTVGYLLYIIPTKFMPYADAERMLFGLVTFPLTPIVLFRDKWYKSLLCAFAGLVAMAGSDLLSVSWLLTPEQLRQGLTFQPIPVQLAVYAIFLSTDGLLMFLFTLLMNRYQNRLSGREWALYLAFPASQYLLIYGWVIFLRTDFILRRVLMLLLALAICTAADALLFTAIRGMAQRSELKARNDLLARQIDRQNEHYAALTAQYENLRRIRHDISSHLYTMQLLLQEGQYDEAAAYSAEVTEACRFRSDLGACENPVVDAFLFSRTEELRAQGYTLQLQVCIPAETGIRNADMVVAFGNLLDNAAEACRDAGEKRLSLSARMDRGFLCIEVRNPAPAAPARHSRRIPELERGIGSHILRALAETYEGSYALTPSGGECTASLLLKGAAA